MSKQLVRKFKWWWTWQDGMHEQWLQQQARAGLHLRSSDPLGVFMTFERGEPAEMAYRWDYPGLKDRQYAQLFADAGWEQAAEVAGWCCWRKPVLNGKAPEIFTDNASKVLKYQRSLGLLLACSLPLLMMAVLPGPRAALLTEPRAAGVAMFALVLLGFGVAGLGRRIFQLRGGVRA